MYITTCEGCPYHTTREELNQAQEEIKFSMCAAENMKSMYTKCVARKALQEYMSNHAMVINAAEGEEEWDELLDESVDEL